MVSKTLKKLAADGLSGYRAPGWGRGTRLFTEYRMRPLRLAVVSLGSFLAIGTGHAQTVERTPTHAAAQLSVTAPVTEWSSRARHHYRSHAAHHRSRGYTSRGFAWFFAREAQLGPQGSCSGNRVVATWYQSGRRTASGAAFNPGGLTAAHRSLPFGSHVTVTNPRNGQSVTVLINDRGPFTRGVTLDLARGAARAIGMTSTQHVCMS
jgi:rare lipoprotein A